MPVRWQAEAHQVLGQSEHRTGLAWEFLLMQCSVGMSPCRMALALGYCLFIWAKSQFGGTWVSETGDFTQGLPVASVVSQLKGEAFALGKAMEVACWLDWVCPNMTLTDKRSSSHIAALWRTEQDERSRAQCCCFLHHQLLLPSDSRGAENICSNMAPYLLIAFPNKNTGAKQQQILFDLCVFLKSVLCAYWELCFWVFLFLCSLSHIPIIPIPHNIFPLP